MAKWKLCRQKFGNEEYEFTEGDVIRIGRGLNNTITLSSIVVSRNHCLINIKKDEVSITDLKSSNGIYVGMKRIPPNVPFPLSDADLIGFGWMIGVPLEKVMDSEKYIFKLIKCAASIISRIMFQNSECEEEETEGSDIDTKKNIPLVQSIEAPISSTKLQLKRKLSEACKTIDIKKEPFDIINIISDSDNDTKTKETIKKKIKLDVSKQDLKTENEDLQYEAFKVKQEYLGYDDEPIQITSDSDSESEQWFARLSQSSPGKAFTKVDHISVKTEKDLDDSSYSQLDGVFINLDQDDNEEEDFIDDLILIPPEPVDNKAFSDKQIEKNQIPVEIETDTTEKSDNDLTNEVIIKDNMTRADNTVAPILQNQNATAKMVQMIEPLDKPSKRKSTEAVTKSKTKDSSKSQKKSKKHSSSSRKHITNSQKEERSRKLKAIADKDKEREESDKKLANNVNSSAPYVKLTSANRGAFLTDVATVKPMKRRHSQDKQKKKSQPSESLKMKEQLISIKCSDKHKPNEKSSSDVEIVLISNNDKKEEKTQNKLNTSCQTSLKIIDSEYIMVPSRDRKPLNEKKDTFSNKPVSKVNPLPPEKLKKKVRFSDAGPIVHEFEIDPGNKMNKIGSKRTSLIDVRQKTVFSLEKITLMKILRWNPQWLNEQITNTAPPPILGHNNPPMSIFHSFKSHNQYIGLIGDLLLMEIWECLTQGYMRKCNQTNGLQLIIESLPPVPPQERLYELSNLSVKVSVPSSEAKYVPRVGEIMMIQFGPSNDINYRFFFVHNVRCLPSTPNDRNVNFGLALYATFTEKMAFLKPGEVIIGKTLAYINKELVLFEAMEYLAASPLSKAILMPIPQHYPMIECDSTIDMTTQWTKTLNPSQKLAVSRSVSATLNDRPCIQMVQGPPGTGKSSVICAIVMTYFYDSMNRKQQNRGKILICATSNAAVDELVIRLLKIRQSLPKEERFRMVRVGRLEAMHARARDVSSQQLAQRDAARARADCQQPGLDEEILHLEAKINMWKTQARDAKDPVRIAYCQGRVANLNNRIALLRGGDSERDSQQLAQAERRIIEFAHIIVTTLASAHNYKMRGLRNRIALCIVDEAGQAIEPETLIPLTLGVTRLTLIGDPQQLPGFICSQRAKQHGLGESLFSRLSSCSEQWRDGPVVLLDQQYRMHPAIADYPNRAFYGGRVRSVAPSFVPLDLPPYTILDVSSGDKGQVSSGANEMEAWGVSRVAAALAGDLRARGLSLAVITPYSAHRDLLRGCLRAIQPASETPVEVNTVDSFQGQERDVMVVSLARSHGVGFLTDAGRMNVMLTRARHALIVCLNTNAFMKNDQWLTLVEDARRRKAYKTLPMKICQPTARIFPKEEILKYVNNTS